MFQIDNYWTFIPDWFITFLQVIQGLIIVKYFVTSYEINWIIIWVCIRLFWSVRSLGNHSEKFDSIEWLYETVSLLLLLQLRIFGEHWRIQFCSSIAVWQWFYFVWSSLKGNFFATVSSLGLLLTALFLVITRQSLILLSLGPDKFVGCFLSMIITLKLNSLEFSLCLFD